MLSEATQRESEPLNLSNEAAWQDRERRGAGLVWYSSEGEHMLPNKAMWHMKNGYQQEVIKTGAIYSSTC